jgi:transcriptional regulator with XRE-family HTH domain
MTARGKTGGKSAAAGTGRRKQSAQGQAPGKKKKTTKKKGAGKKQAARKPPKGPSLPSPLSVTDRLKELVEHAAAGALGRVVDAGGRELAGWLPEATALRHEAGAYLRDLREVAGLTIDELADAIELGDHSLLEAVEAGTATLSFELILRLAAVLARHDPTTFISRLLRSYNPVLWQLFEDWGLGRLPLQLEREREFLNLLRGHDDVRALSDEDFVQVLDFTRVALETALHFAGARAGNGKKKQD